MAKKRGVVVLSLFDGISCGQLALKKARIPIAQYYASEIDGKAVSVTQRNFPQTIQLGDVRHIKANNLPKIDLVIGGSPCQGFSFAGKGLNFDDPRSALFFEYVRLLGECKPQYFLLENVRMLKKHEGVISKYLGVEPVLINSSLLTAHDRKRLYWTNIKIKSIKKKNFDLLDILEHDVPSGLFLSKNIAKRYSGVHNYQLDSDKSCVVGKLSPYQGDRVFDVRGKGSSLSASGGNNGGGGCNIIKDPYTGQLRRLSVVECARLQGVPDNYLADVPKSAAYKMLGNGWTVDVLAHIFKTLKIN